jgi:hypothetical protein
MTIEELRGVESSSGALAWSRAWATTMRTALEAAATTDGRGALPRRYAGHALRFNASVVALTW